jgi:hypothetical protein
MKVSQFRQVLESAARIYRESGNAAAANSLTELSSLCAGRETITVTSFASLIAKTAGAVVQDRT